MNEYIEQKEKEYIEYFQEMGYNYDFRDKEKLQRAMIRDGIDFMENLIKETLLMAKEKTMLDKAKVKVEYLEFRTKEEAIINEVRKVSRVEGYNVAISDTEEKWKELGV